MKMNILLYIYIFLCIPLFGDANFSSVYTDFSKDCKNDPKIKEGDIPLICKGPLDYRIYITYSACYEYLENQKNNKKIEVFLPEQPLGTSATRKLEWRLINLVPQGLIYRTSILEENPDGGCMKKTKTENLNLRSFQNPALEKSIPNSLKANEKARELLDQIIK